MGRGSFLVVSVLPLAKTNQKRSYAANLRLVAKLAGEKLGKLCGRTQAGRDRQFTPYDHHRRHIPEN